MNSFINLGIIVSKLYSYNLLYFSSFNIVNIFLIIFKYPFNKNSFISIFLSRTRLNKVSYKENILSFCVPLIDISNKSMNISIKFDNFQSHGFNLSYKIISLDNSSYLVNIYFWSFSLFMKFNIILFAVKNKDLI